MRYLRLGDVVSATTVLESVSPEKQTRIGPGHFVTWVTTYTDEPGEVVGRQMFRILKFKPDLEALRHERPPRAVDDARHAVLLGRRCKEHRLLIQRCAGCATLRHPPRPMCPQLPLARRGTRSSRRAAAPSTAS